VPPYARHRSVAQPASIIASHILAILRELERRATHGAPMPPGDTAEHGLPRVEG
jgi:hypothetical protein